MTSHGPLALLGSGEYTAAMHETDRALLSRLGSQPQVALVPAASGLEQGSPARWNTLGREHFTALGVAVAPLELLGPEDAHKPALVAALTEADLIYFSGGNPEHLVQTLRASPAWAAISARHAAGAALAGCSAGAMMMGEYTIRVRQVVTGQAPNWLPAMAVVPGIAVLPHFDRMASFVGPEIFQAVIDSAPKGVTLIGIDEDTALVSLTEGRWQVMGRQTVSVFGSTGERVRYKAGEEVVW
jgi:cyanophycinase-like exopeptidase